MSIGFLSFITIQYICLMCFFVIKTCSTVSLCCSYIISFTISHRCDLLSELVFAIESAPWALQVSLKLYLMDFFKSCCRSWTWLCVVTWSCCRAGVVTWSWSPRCSFGLKIFKCLNCCRHHVDSLLLPLSDGRLVYSVARWPWCGTNKGTCKRFRCDWEHSIHVPLSPPSSPSLPKANRRKKKLEKKEKSPDKQWRPWMINI